MPKVCGHLWTLRATWLPLAQHLLYCMMWACLPVGLHRIGGEKTLSKCCGMNEWMCKFTSSYHERAAKSQTSGLLHRVVPFTAVLPSGWNPCLLHEHLLIHPFIHSFIHLSIYPYWMNFLSAYHTQGTGKLRASKIWHAEDTLASFPPIFFTN